MGSSAMERGSSPSGILDTPATLMYLLSSSSPGVPTPCFRPSSRRTGNHHDEGDVPEKTFKYDDSSRPMRVRPDINGPMPRPVHGAEREEIPELQTAGHRQLTIAAEFRRSRLIDAETPPGETHDKADAGGDDDDQDLPEGMFSRHGGAVYCSLSLVSREV